MNVDVGDERHSGMVGGSREVENPVHSDLRTTRREEALLGFGYSIGRSHGRGSKN